MALYHEADRLLVAEEALVILLAYPRQVSLVQPGVQGWWFSLVSPARFADLIVERNEWTMHGSSAPSVG